MINDEIYIKSVELYNNGLSLTRISKMLNINRDKLSETFKLNGIEVKRVFHKKYCDENIFEKIDSEEKAYWLGFIYADGCVGSKRKYLEIALSVKDKEHLQSFKNFIKAEHKLSYKIDKLNRESIRINIENKKLHNDLVKLGCIPRKSLILTFPTEEQVSKEFIRHFIRGYFDGDGCICFTEKTLSINILGTKEFLQGIQDNVSVFKDKNLYPVNYKRKNINSYRIQVEYINDILYFLDYIYDNSTVKLNRKYEKYLKLKNCRPK